MSKEWSWCNDYEYTDPNGRRFDITVYANGSELLDRLNALQAVAEAAKAMEKDAETHTYRRFALVYEEQLAKLRTALAGLEAK